MLNLSEHHQNLLLGKVTQTLSDDEAVELNDLLSNNIEVQQAYEKLVAGIPAELIDTVFSRMRQPLYWKDLAEDAKYKKGKRRRILMRWTSLAALVAGLVIFSWLYVSNHNENKPNNVARQKPTETIKIKLASGKTIDLDNQKGNITEEAAVLVNDGETLNYSVNKNPGNGINSVFVPVGKDYKIVLSDGSEVWMNSVTQLDFPFKFENSTREVTITGEAYLRIAKNSDKPFIVHLPGATVKVLGTEFNVNTYDSGKHKVSLVEGKINVSGSNQNVSVAPGKQAIFDGRSIVQQSFDAKTVLSWRNGLFYLDNADLIQIAEVLNRWYGTSVTVDNTTLFKKRFAGVINKKLPLEVFLDDLKAIGKIESYFDKDGVLHFK